MGAGTSCCTLEAYSDCDRDTAGTAGGSGSSSSVGRNDGYTHGDWALTIGTVRLLKTNLSAYY